MSSSLVSPPLVKARSLSCPNCGAAVELRGFAHTLTAVCPNCLSVLDASSPELQVLHTFQAKQRVEPKIPLGSRGALGGTTYEVIGFQQRVAGEQDDYFAWDEYLLFNPYKGFRYLTEYQGHWNFVRVISALPQRARAGARLGVRWQDHNYAAFDSGQARTFFVLGEFPWQVQVGDSTAFTDFVSPPYMLSSEETDGEVTWSLGEYSPGPAIWQAFKLPGSAPYATGIFANQPSPYQGKVGSSWRTWLWLNVILFAVMILFAATRANRQVFRESYTYRQASGADSAFVTPTFELPGNESNVELDIHTDLDNNWVYFSFALINEETGQAFDFGREVSYYRDSDGTEGSRNNSVLVPAVPSGKYYLRVEPETAPNAPLVSYELSLRRDVPALVFFWIAAALLLIPPIVTSARAAGFEARRWRESDFAPSISRSHASSDSDGGDD
ncbi:MAG TPA: DUF4178 domain-containing protein [Bryobacteraceae bacterium]|nr:DUF4178 domain-containing protein [Bryobacteraceae bacterium]